MHSAAPRSSGGVHCVNVNAVHSGADRYVMPAHRGTVAADVDHVDRGLDEVTRAGLGALTALAQLGLGRVGLGTLAALHGSSLNRGGITEYSPIDARAKKFAANPGFPLDSRAILGRDTGLVIQPSVDVAGLDAAADKGCEFGLGASPLDGEFNGLSGGHHGHRVSKVVCIMKANTLARKRRKLTPMRTIGTIVRTWREAAGLTTAELALKVGGGTKRQNIEQLESGEVKQPRYLTRLAKVMGYTAEDLIALKKPPANSPGSAKSHSNGVNDESDRTYAVPVPFIAWRRIRDVVLLQNSKVEADEGPALLASKAVGPRVKATVVPDESIVGEVAPGTIVLLDPDASPIDGDIVLATMLDGSMHLRVFRQLADGSFDIETTPPRFQSWNSVKHGVVITAVVVAEYRQRRKA